MTSAGVSSRRNRQPHEQQILDEHHTDCHVYELTGALTFGVHRVSLASLGAGPAVSRNLSCLIFIAYRQLRGQRADCLPQPCGAVCDQHDGNPVRTATAVGGRRDHAAFDRTARRNCESSLFSMKPSSGPKTRSSIAMADTGDCTIRRRCRSNNCSAACPTARLRRSPHL